MVEDCPTPHTAVFSTRKEWEAHIKTDHRVQWRCPLCEEDDIVAESEEEMIHHFTTEHENDLKELTLETLLPWSETQVMGISSCPLCSSYGREDSPEIIDHVLKHVYEFSLRALPWTAPFTHDLAKPIGTFNLPNNSDLAERLLDWVDGAEGHTAQELQLSAVEAENYDMAFPEAIEDTGYVPDDEYFDAESAGKSSRPQLADTDPSKDSSATNNSHNASGEGSISRPASPDSLGVCELPPAPDPPDLLDPEDLMDFSSPPLLNTGDESEHEAQRPTMEEIANRALNYINKVRKPALKPRLRREDSPSDHESFYTDSEPEDHMQSSAGKAPTRLRFPIEAPSPPGLDSRANSPHRPGSALGFISTRVDGTIQDLEKGTDSDIWADWGISRKDRAKRSFTGDEHEQLPPRHMIYPANETIPPPGQHTVRGAELEGNHTDSEHSSYEDSELSESVEEQDFKARHPQPQVDEAVASGSYIAENPDNNQED